LCAFAGRFTLEDVESVCSSDDVPAARSLDSLSSLVDKSLVMKEDARGIACFRLHETMREFAGLKLREAGEEEAVELRCADYYVARCQRFAMEGRYGLVEWLGWMDLEIDNVRAVLRRSLNHGDFPRGIAIAGSLIWYWVTRATTEGVRWLDELLAPGRGEPEALALAYFVRGFLAVLQADATVARPALERAVTAARESGQLVLLAHSLSLASIAQNMTGDHASAMLLLDDAQAVSDGVDDVAAKVSVLQARSLNGLLEGDLDTVRSAASKGASLGREIGDLYSLEMMLLNLGGVAMFAGDPDESKALYTESLRIARRIDDRVAQFYLLAGLGSHAAGTGQARLAAQLLGAADTVRIGAGISVNAIFVPLLAQAHELAIAALGASKFEAEFRAGKHLNRDAAVGLALGESGHVAAAAQDHSGTELLGKREADVARLVADGLSNKQIGGRLFISERTVESHVRSILNKLGFNTRAQIAGWMASSNH
jgi:DNA-binding CsgD family transcriptional regulator